MWPTRACPATVSCSARPTERISSSPAANPEPSLTCLKWSMSSQLSANARPSAMRRSTSLVIASEPGSRVSGLSPAATSSEVRSRPPTATTSSTSQAVASTPTVRGASPSLKAGRSAYRACPYRPDIDSRKRERCTERTGAPDWSTSNTPETSGEPVSSARTCPAEAVTGRTAAGRTNSRTDGPERGMAGAPGVLGGTYTSAAGIRAGGANSWPWASCAPAARAAAHCSSVSTPSTATRAPSCSHRVRIARTAAGRASSEASSFTRSGARSVSSLRGTSPSPMPSALMRKPCSRSAVTASSSARWGTWVYGGTTSRVTSQGIRPAARTAACSGASPPRSASVAANTFRCSGSRVSLRVAARRANTARFPSSSGFRRASARMSPVSGRASISSAATAPVLRLTTGWKAKRRVSVQECTGA